MGVLGGIVIACTAGDDDDVTTDTSAHTEGAPLADAPSILWANESFEDFERIAGNGATYLPLDHPLVVRLQFWADAMYAAAAKEQPAIAARVPSPKVAIQRSNVQNAWVSPLPTGWPFWGRIDDPDGGAPQNGAHLMVDMHARVQRVPWTVREMTPTLEDQNALFGFLNSSFEKCRLTTSTGGMAFTDCIPRGSSNLGGKFGYVAVSRWFTMTTGRIAFFRTEEENLATMGHELGHYFRAHPATPRDRFNYFYSLDDRTPGKPKPDMRFWAETEKARAKTLDAGASYVDERILMKDNRLGFYTTEQEADELGMENLMNIGFPPTLIQDKQLHAMQGAGAASDEYAKCIAMRAADWKDAQGNPLDVDVGSLADEHHDNCFRVFNADREMAIHHYVVTAPKPVPPGPSWEEALAAATAPPDAAL